MIPAAALLELLTPPERALLATAQCFRRDYLAPRAAEWERRRQVPREALQEAARCGLTGIEVPRELGGQGAGFVAKALIAANPDRVVWGTDWPHTGGHSHAEESEPPLIEYRQIDDGLLIDRLANWAGDDATLAKVLVHNPMRPRTFSPSTVASMPSIRMLPESGSVRVASIFKRVVLPAPLGPIRAWIAAPAP